MAGEVRVRRARTAGKKVMLFSSGTRGDVQPFIALADHFQKAGFIVQVPTNINHVDFCQKFNLKAIPCSYDMEKLLQEPNMREMMAQGDILKFLKGIGMENAKTFPVNFPRLIAAIDDFKPDVIWCSVLHAWEVRAIAMAKKIPLATAGLQCTIPSKYQQTMLGEPSWAPHKNVGYYIGRNFVQSESAVKNKVIIEHCPEAEEYIPQSFAEMNLGRYHPYAPVVYAFSPSLYKKFPDWSDDCKKHVVFSGFWVVSMAEQKRRMQNQDAAFGGSDMPEMTAFINAGNTAPVYLGWGSMMAVSPEFMGCLTIRSLMQAKLRAIVLGGWADLSLDKLEGQPDTEAMKAFCKDNVLFVKTAPHEWLFPQCSVTVHHGGSGTLAAAVRAGKPTIITPVAFDQFENGLLAQNGGSGIRTCRLSKLTAPQLAKYLIKCTTDKDMIRNAVKLGDKLCNEDGLDNAVKIMDNWILEDVVTGRYAALEKQRIKELHHLRANPPGNFYYFLQFCCMCSPSDWSVNRPSNVAVTGI